MELSRNGRFFLLLGITLLIMGVLFSNTLLLVLAGLTLLYLVSNGISFHREFKVPRNLIKFDLPLRAEVGVGKRFRIGTTLINSSNHDFWVIRFSYELPGGFEEQDSAQEWRLLPAHGKLQIENLLKTKIPGKFQITASILVFEVRRQLFRQSATLPCDVTIVAQPFIEKIGPSFDANVLYDLSADTLRRGQGTDLAGIRPSVPSDDFHKIDWKASARTGKLMTWESYLERDPAIMLMIDLRSLIWKTRSGLPAGNVILSELAKLLAMIRLTTPIGLIMYDDRRVVANLQASLGAEIRERIMLTLLETSGSTHNESLPLHRATHSYDDLTRETYALKALYSGTNSKQERLSSFSRAVYPFYQRLKAKHRERLRKQGVFAAFDIICRLSESVLVIAISHQEIGLVELLEGAKEAASSNHRVIVTLLNSFEETLAVDKTLGAHEFGLRIIECAPQALSSTVSMEILEMSRTRSATIATAR